MPITVKWKQNKVGRAVGAVEVVSDIDLARAWIADDQADEVKTEPAEELPPTMDRSMPSPKTAKRRYRRKKSE